MIAVNMAINFKYERVRSNRHSNHFSHPTRPYARTIERQYQSNTER
jgi:hypothetical protein